MQAEEINFEAVCGERPLGSRQSERCVSRNIAMEDALILPAEMQLNYHHLLWKHSRGWKRVLKNT